MKKLLFDGRNLVHGLNGTSARSGIYFVTFNLLKYFIENEAFDVTVFCNIKDVLELKKDLKEKTNKDVKFLFENQSVPVNKWDKKKRRYKSEKKHIRKLFCDIVQKIVTPRLIFNEKYDVYFSPQEAFLDSIKADKRFIVLYDAIPLIDSKINPAYVDKSWYYYVIQQLNSKDGYFAISQSTKNDFLKFAPQLKPEQITVTPLASGNNFYQETDAEKIKAVRLKYNIPADKKYVFSLCTLEPRKNLIRAVKTFIQFIDKNKIDDLVFVLGGGQWDWFIEKLENEIDNLGEYKNKIIRAGYVDDADLAALYSDAQWFVYTSQYEGFGLPPLEAMQCGCPVITSNNSSLPEVVGDAGVMIDWDNDEQHVEAYEQYYFNDDLRRSNAAKGLERAKEFSWQKTANLMITEMLK